MSPFFRTLIFTIIAPGFWTVLVPLLGAGPWGTARVAGRGGRWRASCRRRRCALFDVCVLGLRPARQGNSQRLLIRQRSWLWKGRIASCGTPCIGACYASWLGEALAFRSVALAEMACVFFAFAALFVMVFEEPTLRRKFGEEYEAYRRQVPAGFRILEIS